MGCTVDDEFEPERTALEVLALGVFGGKYMTDCREEFPAAATAGGTPLSA